MVSSGPGCIARCLSNAARCNACCTQDGPDLNELEQLVRVDVVKHAVHHAQRTVLAHLCGCVHREKSALCTATVAQPQNGGIAYASLSTRDRMPGAAMLQVHHTAYATTCSEQDLPAPLSRESPAWPCSSATQECRTGSPCPLQCTSDRNDDCPRASTYRRRAALTAAKSHGSLCMESVATSCTVLQLVVCRTHLAE